MFNRDDDRQQFEEWHKYGRDRGFFDRAGDEVRSWFGDEEAERRRRMDAQMHGSQRGRGWGHDGEGRGHERGHERDMPAWQRRDYAGGSPRGSEIDERSRYDMEIGSRRHEAGQRSWQYGGSNRGGEYGGGMGRDGESYGMGHERESYGNESRYGREAYGREEGRHSRPQNYGSRFFGHRDEETGMGWGGGRDSEQEQGWGQQQGMFGGQRGGMFGGSGMHRGRGPRNFQRNDERILDEIHQLLTFHPEIDASDIEILCDKGVLTLRGKVENRMSKRMTEDVCEDVYGVREVHNELRVENGLFNRNNEEQPTKAPRNNLMPR